MMILISAQLELIEVTLQLVRRPKLFSPGALAQLLVKIFESVVVLIHCQPVNGEPIGNNKTISRNIALNRPGYSGELFS